MAVPQVSKMITDRQRQCEFADQFVVSHRDALVAALDRVFQEDFDEGHRESGALRYIDSLVRRLRRALADLVAAEQRHLAELADDGVYRDRRDEAARALRDVLFDFRRMFRSTFGDRKAEEAGFERRIAQHPLALLRQTGRITSTLRDPAFELPAPRYEGVAVTREKVAEHLETPAHRLRQAVDDLTSEQTKAHGTKVAKDRAMADFDEVYGTFVKNLVSTFKLAGMHELAERLTLKLARRPDRTEEPSEEASPETSESPEPSAFDASS